MSFTIQQFVKGIGIVNSTIFEFLYPTYKINKPIRLIELFAGYGSQALALKYLGVEFEHWKICEWAVKSIQAYKDVHFGEDKIDYSSEFSIIEINNFLYNCGISRDYNRPMTYNEIKKNSKNSRHIFNNIIATRNLVNIQQIEGKDLDIVDTDKFTYILTYSFPCQDLSLAGKRKGMSDTSTRSGMLWEVERILCECKELGNMPEVLLMENVPQVHGTKNVDDFNKWQLKLEELGYKNYCKDLIATDYGIPQTRNRCFMISILGDYNYSFPKRQPLKLKLMDVLEKEVDDKYLISPRTVKCFLTQKENGFPRRDRFIQSLKLTNEKQLAGTLTTLQGSKATDNHILVKTATKLGYQEANVGDEIDFSQSKSKTRRGRVQKDKVQTLTTKCNIGTITEDLKIRNLTPKECFRLMGVKEEDFEKISKNQSDSSLYHLAGDSIVVNVLMAIFKELFRRK